MGPEVTYEEYILYLTNNARTQKLQPIAAGPLQNHGRTKELQAKNVTLKEERDSLRHATGMLNSMVLGGESHSDTSRQIVKDAMMGKVTKSS